MSGARHWKLRGAHAVELGSIAGRKVYRVPVEVEKHRGIFADPEVVRVYVVAHSAADAGDYVVEEVRATLGAGAAQTTVRAYGPRGGKVERFTGWYSAIAHCMGRAHRGWRQAVLPAAEVAA